jgi:predicted PurR-regulated permease PerM
MVGLRTEQDRLETVTFYVIVALVGYGVYLLFQPFFTPLGWAAVLAVCCHPWHRRLERRFGRTLGATLSTILVSTAIIVPGVLVVAAFAREAAHALTEMPTTFDSPALRPLQQASDWVHQRVLARPSVPLPVLVEQWTSTAAGFIAAEAGTLVVNVLAFLLYLVVTLFAVFFFFRDGAAIMRTLRRGLPFPPAERERLLWDTGDLIQASVTSALIVASLQGLLGGVLFWTLGIGAPVFWGVMMAFFALLPFGGAAIVWLPASVGLALNGRVGAALVMFAVGAGVVSTVDNVLRPVLLSGRSQLNGLLVFVGLLGGVATFGLLGIVLGPVILAIAVALFEAYTVPTDRSIAQR